MGCDAWYLFISIRLGNTFPEIRVYTTLRNSAHSAGNNLFLSPADLADQRRKRVYTTLRKSAHSAGNNLFFLPQISQTSAEIRVYTTLRKSAYSAGKLSFLSLRKSAHSAGNFLFFLCVTLRVVVHSLGIAIPCLA